MLIASLVLHQVKGIGTIPGSSGETNSECTTLAYIGITLTILSLIIVMFLHYRKTKSCKGHRFSNAVKIMIFISDVQNYVPINLCKTVVGIHLFKIMGTLKAKNITLIKNYLWDALEIHWKEVTVTFNENKIDLPRVVVIKLKDKIKVRWLMNREPLFSHLMLKQGITWFTLATGTQENHVNIKSICADILQFFFTFRCHASCNLNATFYMGSSCVVCWWRQWMWRWE